jgi:hypothetical protein
VGEEEREEEEDDVGNLRQSCCPICNPFFTIRVQILMYFFSVAETDPYVFGPSGSGSISTRYGSGARYFYHQAKKKEPGFLLFYDFFMT